MLHAGEVKGELARIHPARSCCRRAELAGLLLAAGPDAELRTLDHAIARTAVHLSTALGAPIDAPRAVVPDRAQPPGTRHHLVVQLDPDAIGGWSWEGAAACDRRAFMRGSLLGAGSLSFGRHGAHLEFTYRGRQAANTLARRLRELDVPARRLERRGRHLVYLKGQEEIASVLRLAGANRGLLELESGRVGREVRSRLNRLLNAEQANLGRTVRAADRQLRAIERLAAAGRLESLSQTLRDAARARQRQPEADLDTLSATLGVSRSATNHRLRRLVELADDLD
jgi:cell division protein WhiA